MDIRTAVASDAAGVEAIYTAEVLGGFATFDTVPRSVEDWAAVIEHRQDGHEFLVAADGDVVLGYAKTGRFRERPAYARTVEPGVYVATPGRGIGNALFTALLARLDAGPAHLAVSNIALPNAASVRLHEKHGFTHAGTLREVGFKLGAWHDVGSWQRPLGGWTP